MEEQKFEPFQKVLVRTGKKWAADFFSHLEDWGEDLAGDRQTGYATTSGCVFAFYDILPFDEDTKHLLGTKEDPKPKWEPKPGELVAVWGDNPKHVVAREYVKKSADGNFVCLYGGYMEDRHGCEAEWPNCAPLRKHFNVPDEE